MDLFLQRVDGIQSAHNSDSLSCMMVYKVATNREAKRIEPTEALQPTFLIPFYLAPLWLSACDSAGIEGPLDCDQDCST